MPKAEQPQRQKRPGRLQVAPPALLGQGEPFDGYNVVQEWQNPLAVLAWQVLRDAMLWARCAGAPGVVFRSAALRRRTVQLAHPSVPQDLRAPLAGLSRVLEPNASPSRDELAHACRAVSRWAESQKLPQTAISFAQGAAIIHPTHADHAYHVGMLCRRAAEYPRAETWYRRALRLAKTAGDNKTAALSWLGIGNIFIQRGDYETAKRTELRAFRIARRWGLWNIKGMALHDLFTIAVEQGDVAAAESLARQALQAYPATADRLPALASDAASHWLYQGFYGRALTVFQAVLPTLQFTSERLLILSLISRAAAGVGDLARFTSAWTEAWAILDREPNTDRACSALYNLAYASAFLGDWERACMAAKHSASVASKRGEAEIYRIAAQLLEDVRQETFKPSLSSRPEEPAILGKADELARRFIKRLAARAGRPRALDQRRSDHAPEPSVPGPRSSTMVVSDVVPVADPPSAPDPSVPGPSSLRRGAPQGSVGTASTLQPARARAPSSKRIPFRTFIVRSL